MTPAKKETKMIEQVLLITGVVLLVCGVGAYLNPATFRKIVGNYTDTPALVYWNGIINLALGGFIILNHNIWEMSWVVIITIVGWLALLRGLWILLGTKSYLARFRQFWGQHGHLKGEALFLIIFGVIFIYASINLVSQ